MYLGLNQFIIYRYVHVPVIPLYDCPVIIIPQCYHNKTTLPNLFSHLFFIPLLNGQHHRNNYRFYIIALLFTA